MRWWSVHYGVLVPLSVKPSETNILTEVSCHLVWQNLSYMYVDSHQTNHVRYIPEVVSPLVSLFSSGSPHYSDNTPWRRGNAQQISTPVMKLLAESISMVIGYSMKWMGWMACFFFYQKEIQFRIIQKIFSNTPTIISGGNACKKLPSFYDRATRFSIGH